MISAEPFAFREHDRRRRPEDRPAEVNDARRDRRFETPFAISARRRPARRTGSPPRFRRKTGLLYIPHNNLCMEMQGVQANYIAGTPYVGANVRMYAGPGGIAASSRPGIR